jgi:NADH-quinone oxidoreductase subunit L
VITKSLLLWIALAPLGGAILAGFFGRQIGRVGAHVATIAGVAISCALSIYVFKLLAFDGVDPVNLTVYTWFQIGDLNAQVGFLVDRLTALMMVVVTFVSLMVHIYTIGYMREDPGYQRFFAYIALFTFAMLMLVMANNFAQLFFGWEAVGLVSYLLIGFWYKRPTAIFANLKAFLVNRVGDFGFLLGIAGVLAYLGTLDYATAFARASELNGQVIDVGFGGLQIEAATAICLLLFVGAMGKSAQVPLHVWLPDSMEGPTPISALIHAATMVTAGIFMVARMSPLFEFSDTALTVVMVIGAITALSMGLIGIVQNDIKRVIAYSTLSQLGYMTVALGVSAYSVAIFHLATHAFFKALLFLGAGAVIMAMHHEQDLRKMGGLRKFTPITWITAWIGTLALVGTPFFSGFYSKDLIIEAARHSERAGAGFAYACVLLGVFVTAFYSFRMFFMVFHGPERFREPAGHGHGEDHHDDHDEDHGHHGPVEPRESPWVVTVPLILLAIPSVVAGYVVGPMLFGDFFRDSLFVLESQDVLGQLGAKYTGVLGFVLHGIMMPPFWLAMAGLATAWFLYMKRPDLPPLIAERLRLGVHILEEKYGFDRFNDRVFAAGSRGLGRWLWRYGDAMVIDGLLVNGTARSVGWIAARVRGIQTGFLYHYAFVMIIGLLVLIFAFVI